MTAVVATRTGLGIYLNHQYDSGLQTIRKCSSRGWLKGYQVGNGALTKFTYNASITECEASTVTHGIHLTYNARASLVQNCYLEGGDGGYAIWDEGDYNKAIGNFTFAGFAVHLKSTNFTYGNYYTGNTFSAGTKPNQVLIDLTSSSVGGGPGKVCFGNHLSFGGSGGTIEGVVGMQVNGSDPRINAAGGQTYYPRGPWIGGDGTKKVNNLSASSDGTTGTGIYGLSMVQDQAGNIEVPYVGRGAVNLKVDPTVITTSSLASNVLTLGELSVFTVTFGSAGTINRFTAPNLPDKTFEVHITNANATLQQGTYLKLQGSADFTPGANGSWHRFQIKPGGVAWETSRIAY
jgi:hypothetical protein